MEIQDSNLIVLFKSGTTDNSDPYLKLLEKHGFKGHCIPILDFNFINLVQYGQLLKKLDKYLAIVFTSPRAVQATQMVLSSVDIPMSFIKKVKCYTVGKATAQAAKKLGFDPSGECSGNAELLSQFIVQENKCAENREVLFPCGNLCRDVIRETLTAHSQCKIFRLEEIKVYETIAKEDIYDELFRITQSKVPIHAIVMFSPSGVPVLINTIRKCPQLSLHSVKILAVGPTTESELQKHNMPVYATLRRPDPQSLIECLQK
ncbi:uroporphyrinogen-III synthase-like [Saccostrea cucullata]|uniref:uroporphyrinogen-III synthase-like n=1 Tax=Saccostrea cuccullata TaxID=36930 RepID=UPI002ED117F9